MRHHLVFLSLATALLAGCNKSPDPAPAQKPSAASSSTATGGAPTMPGAVPSTAKLPPSPDKPLDLTAPASPEEPVPSEEAPKAPATP